MRTSFPRTRGDGPEAAVPRALREWFPPHSRGWTALRQSGRHPEIVSPALAGMDPGRCLFVGDFVRFPRTRGDGPLRVWHREVDSTFPPHSRGWTLAPEADRLADTVSPALAGMDRMMTPPAYASRSFPRTRGDGPTTGPSARRAIRFPPHSRGWTPARASTTSSTRVSPALAGMDLAEPIQDMIATGFPRTRGDGPLAE